ncbi:MAG TPA: sigma-54 dependent transcriptional regulator [Opitutaceae bacterium]|nr:sigma-54 dependent transcriptional regulator [Opitutaceae bacterium]
MKLLIIGDEQKSRRLVSWGFASETYQVRTANSRTAVDALAGADAFHAACIDLKMREDDSSAIMELLHRRVPQLPIVAVTGADDDRPLAAFKMRGVRAVMKAPLSIDKLRTTIAQHGLREPVGAALPRIVELAAPERPALIADDETTKRVLEVARRGAASSVAMLILGETGTGKSLLAQTIHAQSALKHRPFVTVSCPCLNRELLESDLFGHVRGAFTGAVQDTWGKVAAAEGGTLFLDEIGDLPASLQPKLLRLLQEKQYERVGETTPRTATVRVIAATNHDLKADVAAGKFREDLYYRLNVIALEVPPLRQRPRDIMPAAESFRDEICRQLGRTPPAFTIEVQRIIESYAWPGNLRELRNVIERAAILSRGPAFEVADFAALMTSPSAPRCQVGAPVSLQTIEEAHIQMVVANSASLEEAARILEIDKSTLYRKRKAMEARVAKFAPAGELAAATGS